MTDAAPAGAAKYDDLPRRSPLIAGILSAILPGTGHIYAGHPARGASYLGLFAVMALLIFWARSTHEFEVFPGLIVALVALLALFWLWLLFSAALTAGGRSLPPALGLTLVLAFTYLLGWQATEVNLRKFLTEFPDTFSILTRVMWPWSAAVERPEELAAVDAPFANPCPEDLSTLPAQEPGTDEAPWVVIEPGCGEFAQYVLGEGLQPGTELVFRGGGFDPNEPVEIWWRDSLGNEFRPIFEGDTITTVTDDQGRFSVTFGAPQGWTATQVGVQFHDVEARQVISVGRPRLTQNFRLAVNRMIVTIFQALMATTFGIVLAIPFSFLAARNLMWHSAPTRAIYYAIRFVMNVTRSIEPIIWAVIAAVWVGLGPFAGVIALTIHTIASLGKLYSEAIESIDPGPIEAVTATGASRLQTIVYAIIPQVIPPFLSFTIYRWDINVRMSTIIGFVGGGGIGQILFQWINQSRWNAAGMAVWLIALTVSIMDYASGELRKRVV